MEGWTVPIRDSDQIADHLRQLHADRESAFRMGQNARRRAEQYSWARLERTLVAAVCRDGSTNPCLT
jgi:glycosyltransferase involved in cell wall biosynthesis